jgi:uncharacterized protein YndB with AHSA1/START domain
MSNKTTLTADKNSPIVKIERIFDAPREKVFAAHTEKDKIEKWWGAFGETHAEIDLRVGGAWRFAEVQPDGQEIAFHGIFHEVTAPERIVQTEEFANIPERGHVILDRYEFIDLGDGKTKLILTFTFLSQEDCSLMIESDMESGVVRQYQNLDKLLQEML